MKTTTHAAIITGHVAGTEHYGQPAIVKHTEKDPKLAYNLATIDAFAKAGWTAHVYGTAIIVTPGGQRYRMTVERVDE